MAADEARDEATAALEHWLTRHIPGATAVRVGDATRPEGGYSAETLIVPLTYVVDGAERFDRVVLRAETPDPPIYPQQVPGMEVEIEIQYRAMRAVANASDVPIAPLVGYEADATVLGAPFFVMGFIDGDVPSENPLYTRSGFFVDASAPQRRRMVEDGLRILAAIHAVDWRAAGLDWLVAPGVTPGLATQLELWERAVRHELRGREHPAIERALGWLRAHLADLADTSDERSVGLCWGDPRPGNMIWRDFRCACVTDWEAAAIAPPEVDLGWWLMFDRWSHETAGVPRLPGEPTREEQRELYAGFAGRGVADTYGYELFAAFRYAAIVVRVMNRMVERGQLPPEQTIWVENPAVDCLVELLEEAPSARA